MKFSLCSSSLSLILAFRFVSYLQVMAQKLKEAEITEQDSLLLVSYADHRAFEFLFLNDS